MNTVLMLITETLSASTSVEGEAAPLLLLLLGPAGAAGVYWGLYRYYRNTDKSHSFETETAISARPVTGHDQKIKRITGTSRSDIQGNNATNHRDRVKRV